LKTTFSSEQILDLCYPGRLQVTVSFVLMNRLTRYLVLSFHSLKAVRQKEPSQRSWLKHNQWNREPKIIHCLFFFQGWFQASTVWPVYTT